ncbi:MAG: hypothetical protein OXD54_09660 [Candidatus Poribacteria bacterium]|nr:hypothetical protein [Candidatus Poribacteria bacterium]
MKKTLRITIIFISVAIIVTGIGVWRHHYLKIMKAEPEKVYNDTLSQPNTLPDNTKTSKVTPIKSDASTGVEKESSTGVKKEDVVTTQYIDNSNSPETNENISHSYTGTLFSDIAEKDLSPEVVAALKKYEEIQSAQASLEAEYMPIMKARPLDWDVTKLMIEKMSALNQQGIDALETLAPYSQEASNALQTAIERKMLAAEMSTGLKDNLKELNTVIEQLNELQKSLPTTSSGKLELPSELNRAIEQLNELQKSLPTTSR